MSRLITLKVHLSLWIRKLKFLLYEKWTCIKLLLLLRNFFSQFLDKIHISEFKEKHICSLISYKNVKIIFYNCKCKIANEAKHLICIIHLVIVLLQSEHYLICHATFRDIQPYSQRAYYAAQYVVDLAHGALELHAWPFQ